MMTEILNLSTNPDAVNPAECIQYLQHITSDAKSLKEAQHLLDHIATIIQNETTPRAIASDGEVIVNQVVLNLSFRSYYAVLERFELPDKHFNELTQKLHKETDFLMLNAMLLTNRSRHLNIKQVWNSCLEAMINAINENSTSLLVIVKSLNLLCRKDDSLDLDINIEHIYYLLQCQIFGLREETLTLFSHCVKDAQRATKFFLLITEFWPWTNKNKYYLLSCILNAHSLQSTYFQLTDAQNFFSGLRLSLTYKRLFAAGQYLVKSLSCQESEELLQMSAEILTHGSHQEINNFYSQWFGRILQKDALFELMQQQLEIADALQRFNMLENDRQRYRLILIFSMFSRQVLHISKLLFFKISTELITNCFDLDADSQLLIFKFVVNNLANFAIEDCLEFVLRFIQTHKGAETAQYRNNILGKLPTIINYISRTFNKLDVDDSSTLKGNIKCFFRAFQQMIEVDIVSSLYQPKIFAIKLLQILIKSLFSKSPLKNAKNCSVVQNQNLGQFLIEAGDIFNAVPMQSKLLSLIHDPQGFDDALQLLVDLLKELNYDQTEEALELCQKIVLNCSLDECSLSSLYAQIAVNSFAAAQTPSATMELFTYCFETIDAQLESFESDPLYVCKIKNHLFGFLETINVCIATELELLRPQYKFILDLLENILAMILKMLNLYALRNTIDADVPRSASFQDMDESLELLVKQSAFEAGSHEECRKFLLMSFWLTLKACCELATTIGCRLMPSSEMEAEDLKALEKCLQINVSVLTKCRHKGAIEAAGLTIGKLTRCLTEQLPMASKSYHMLQSCVDLLLFEHGQQLSTTRRGAGLSIMFLHVVKNEQQGTRPLLQRAMRNILSRLNETNAKKQAIANTADKYDCMEALILHYLCVLVKDTELRDAMSKYHDCIMLAAMRQIDNPEWTVCNAALQLFGALVPKIIGQKQATDFETPIGWEPTELTFMEITLRLPKTCAYILNYCSESKKEGKSTSIRSIILFLSFLAKVDHLRKTASIAECDLLCRFRQLMWSLLTHRVEKVRKLAAICFVRAHEFRCELPLALLEISKLLFDIKDENFFHGMLHVLIEGINKIQHESVFTVDKLAINTLFSEVQSNLAANFQIKQRNLYSLCKLLELMILLDFKPHSELMSKLVNSDMARNCIGSDVFQEKVTHIMNSF